MLATIIPSEAKSPAKALHLFRDSAWAGSNVDVALIMFLDDLSSIFHLLFPEYYIYPLKKPLLVIAFSAYLLCATILFAV